MKPCSENKIKLALINLEGWAYNDGAIEKRFVFTNFIDALGFILKVGICSEKINHHAEIFNVFNKVQLRLTTHDALGVTENDFLLAAAIEKQL
ncbi:MAG: 4a-hydroxytetrahydrobiopterin dehydratase [Burkholderiales bacterium]|nr:4a-hydroxytetrahydrobiopterin dehydratase [Flavobacterium sp.]